MNLKKIMLTAILANSLGRSEACFNLSTLTEINIVAGTALVALIITSETSDQISYDDIFKDFSGHGYWKPINKGLFYTTLQFIGEHESDYDSANLTLIISNYSLLSMERMETIRWSSYHRLYPNDTVIVKKFDGCKEIAKKAYLGKVIEVIVDKDNNPLRATIQISFFNEATQKIEYRDIEISPNDNYSVIIIKK